MTQVTPPSFPNLSNAARLAQDPMFRDRALVAAIVVALVVLREPESTAGHAFRVGYAQSLLRAPTSYQDSVSWVLAADPGVANVGADQASIPDTLLYQRATLLWDGLSQL